MRLSGSRLLILVLALAGAVITSGCGGVTGAAPSAPNQSGNSGSGSNPTVAVSVSPDAASVQVGQTWQFTPTVTGTTNTAVTWSASGGSISNSGLYTAPASAGTFVVTATSVADTTKSASATVTVSVAVTQLVNISPTSVAFGNVLVGNTSTKPVTVTNTGTGSVMFTAGNFTGSGFSATGLTLPFTLSPGASQTVNIQFSPDISGPFSGSASVVSNATNSPSTVSLSGTGLAPQPHSVDLSWTGSTSSDVAGYYVYRSTTSGGGYARVNSSADAATTFTDSTVNSGVTYYYVVTAVDSSGDESAYSNQSTAVIPIP